MSKSPKKKQKIEPELNSPISSDLLSTDSRVMLRKAHDTSGPYQHAVFKDFCNPAIMRQIHEEATAGMKATYKETDLFKLYQTGELALLSKESGKMSHLLALREALYSAEFRQFISDVTGCGELTDRVDCAANAYVKGCHLLCHDDVIGTRKVSYIIYFPDPDDDFEEKDGGCLELYPLDKDTIVDRGVENGGIQGSPECCPTVSLVPKFNTMGVFIVQPGRSYHSVQEVYSDKPRLSIQGWFHAAAPPPGSDLASLKQIMTQGDDLRPFTPIPGVVVDDTLKSTSSNAAAGGGGDKGDSKSKQQLKKSNDTAGESSSPTEEELKQWGKDKKELSKWINPTYLEEKSIQAINKQFCKDSSVELKNFLIEHKAAEILQAAHDVDAGDQLGEDRRPMNYEVGVTENWTLVGPPHKRRHLLYSNHAKEPKENVGAKLNEVRNKVFATAAFARYLKRITELTPLGYRDELRRFRPGIDYTVAHYGAMTKIPRLDATLCFVNDETRATGSTAKKPQVGGEKEKKGGKEEGGKVKGKEEEGEKGKTNTKGKKKGGKQPVEDKQEEEEEEEEEEFDEGGVWDSGNVGGFECYIVADEQETAEAAEVYKSDNQEEEESLLSVSPGANILSLVMRDQGIMRFVKYVSSAAPGSRWDVSFEYEIEEIPDDGDDGEEGDDDDDDSEDDDDEEED